MVELHQECMAHRKNPNKWQQHDFSYSGETWIKYRAAGTETGIPSSHLSGEGDKVQFHLNVIFCRISREKHQFATKFLHFSGFVEAQQNLVPKPLNSSIIPDWLETKPSQKTFIGPSVSQVFPSIRIGVYSSF